jgi:hypothetical protein
VSAREDTPADPLDEGAEASAETAETDPGRTVASGSSLRARLAAETRAAADEAREAESEAPPEPEAEPEPESEPQAAPPEPEAVAPEPEPEPSPAGVEPPAFEMPPLEAPPFEDAQPAPKRGGGPNPLVLIAIAFFLGVLLAKIIDWRGHAHPR